MSRRGDKKCDEMKSSHRRPYVGRSVEKNSVLGSGVLCPEVAVVVGSTGEVWGVGTPRSGSRYARIYDGVEIMWGVMSSLGPALAEAGEAHNAEKNVVEPYVR